MRYVQKRSYSWSPLIAYSVGLIASDGCLQKDGRHIDFTSTDIEQLNNFCLSLGRNIPISRKQNSSLQLAYRVQFSDVAYYDFLLAAGLMPNKSKVLNALAIPSELYADFLRGVFDGDGTTYGYMDPRWKSSFMFYIGFTSASLNFVRYLQAENMRLASLTSGSLRAGTRAYTLMYAKADAHKLYSYMYYSKNMLCLSRKRIKLEAFINKDLGDILI